MHKIILHKKYVHNHYRYFVSKHSSKNIFSKSTLSNLPLKYHYFSSSSFSSSSSSTLWNNSTTTKLTQGLLSLLSNQQRSLLEEQREVSKSILSLAHKVGGVNLQHIHSSRNTLTLPFLQQILESTGRGDNYNDNDNGGGGNGDDDDVLDSTFAVVVAGEFNAGRSFHFPFC